MGRTEKYEDTFPLLAEGYAREGMIDTEIAAKLGISHETFYQYQHKYPEFLEAIKRGKAPVDVEVENALLKRARGYEYEESTVEYKAKKDAEEKAKPISIKKTTKQVVPDVTAQKFWLMNRKPDKWREKSELDIRDMTYEVSDKYLPDIKPQAEAEEKGGAEKKE